MLNLFGPPGHIDTLQYFRCAGIVSGTPHPAVLDTLFTPTYILYNIHVECCRYASCLEAGMKPELVLSEEKKEQRFWKKLGTSSSVQTTFNVILFLLILVHRSRNRQKIRQRSLILFGGRNSFKSTPLNRFGPMMI